MNKKNVKIPTKDEKSLIRMKKLNDLDANNRLQRQLQEQKDLKKEDVFVMEKTDISWCEKFDGVLPGMGYNQAFCGLFLGLPGSGKTNFVRYVNFLMKDDITRIIVYSNTANKNYPYPYPGTLKKDRIQGLDFEHLREIMEQQTELAYKNIERQENGEEPIMSKIHIIFDDVISDNKLRQKENNPVTEIVANRRHYMINISFLTQMFTNAFPPDCRKGVNFAACTRLDDETTRKLFAEYYLSLIGGTKLGEKIINTITSEKQFQFVIIDRSKIDIEHYKDICFKCVAPEKVPAFKLLTVEDEEEDQSKLLIFCNKEDDNDKIVFLSSA